MAKVLMIGAGGVATVAAFKIAQNADVFTDFMIASRRKEKCDKIVADIHKAGYKMNIQTAQVDADDVEQLKALFSSYQPENIHGSGASRTVSNRLASRQSSVADSIQGSVVSIPPTPLSITSTRSTISTLSIVMQVTIIMPLPQTSIPKSTSARLPRRDFTIKTDNGLRQNRWKSTNHSPTPISVPARAICSTMRSWSRW